MFEIRVKHKFRANHALTNYSGGTEKSHNHEWICEAFIQSEKLDSSGCAIDFLKVDEALSKATAEISGGDINEHPFFKEISPSAENIAFFIFGKLSDTIKKNGARLVRITVSEDLDHAASFIEK